MTSAVYPQGAGGGLALTRRRAVLLGTLQQALSQLHAVAAQLDTWRSQAAGLEQQLLQTTRHSLPTHLNPLQVGPEPSALSVGATVRYSAGWLLSRKSDSDNDLAWIVCLTVMRYCLAVKRL